jgi:hypothetical protein
MKSGYWIIGHSLRLQPVALVLRYNSSDPHPKENPQQ